MKTCARASWFPIHRQNAGRATHRFRRRRAVLQRLEPRVVLATDQLLISELVSSNSAGLRDYHDDSSDWIEIRNAGLDSVDLQGWHLTDDPNDLDKWRFPQQTELAPGEHLVVFASGRGNVTTRGERHTNFRLSRGGDYVALVGPDGETVAYEFSPDLPQQFTDVSYGLAEVTSTTQLAPIEADAKVLLPTDGSLGNAWTSNDFDDSDWLDTTTGVGFATFGADELRPAFTVRMIDIDGGNDGRLRSALEADRILQGDFSTDDYEVAVDITMLIPQINFGAHNHTFPDNSPYLDGTVTTRLSDFVIQANAQVTIPEGKWTIGWGSDEGGILRMGEVSFLETFNEDGTTTDGDGELIFDGTRNHSWTRGTLTVGPGGQTTDLDIVVFERNGVDAFELAITSGHVSDDVSSDTWTLLADGALGWTVETLTSPPVPDIVDLINSSVEGQMFNQGTSAYLRIPFEVDDPAAIDQLLLRMNYDDAFVAHLNGTEVARDNFTGDPMWNSTADAGRRDAIARTVESYDLSGQLGLIQRGKNILAIQGITERADTGGFLVLPELLASRQLPAQLAYMATPTPGSPNGPGALGVAATSFAPKGGTFTDTATVELSTNLPSATIRYTVDGSVPDETSLLYTGPIELTDTTQIRAKAFRPDYVSLPTVSETYFKLATDVHQFTSNLPVMIIDHFTAEPLNPQSITATNSAFALFEPQADGRTDYGSSPTVTGRSGIHVRGTSSRGFGKKSYRFEVWEDEANEDRNVSLLGLPEESDWVLLAPDTMDPALIRNSFLFDISNQVGRYAPKTSFVEMYLNVGDREITESDYVGIYAIQENIKRSPERVDVEKLSLNYTTRPLIEGGYILVIDGLSPGPQPIQYVEPKEFEIKQRPEQEAFISNYIEQFTATLYSPGFTHPEFGHYGDYIDVPSWIDFHLLNELGWSTDGLWRSAHMFKTRDGKLEKGPLWDYDRSFGSRDALDDNPSSWYRSRFRDWWGLLFEDPEFHQAYIDRWQELRSGPFSLENLHGTIDRIAEPLVEAQVRNFDRWTPESPRDAGGDGFKSGELDGTWHGELRHMKAWIAARVEFLDGKFLGSPQLSTPGGPVSSPHSVDISGPPNAFIYYTLDGTDPRQPSGRINPHAIRVGSVETYVDGSSEAKYLIPKGEPSEADWQSPSFVDSSWQSGKGAIGFDTGVVDTLRTKSGFTVRQVHSGGRLINLASADRLLAGNNVASETTVEGVAFINYLDTGDDGSFSDNNPFPNGGGDNFALRATAMLVVPEDGMFTFGTNSDDGSRLRIDGNDVVVANVHRLQDRFGTVFLTAGEHELDFVMFQRRSGAETELFVAPGTHDSFGDDFRLVGDVIEQTFAPLIQTDVKAQMHGVNASLYARIPFDVGNVEEIRRLSLAVQFDDGFVAYLNGVKVAQRNAPEVAEDDSTATSQRIDVRAVAAEEIDLFEFKDVLLLGENILAIHGLNVSSGNADFLLVPDLSAVFIPESTPIPLQSTTTIIARAYDRTFDSDYVAAAEVWSGAIAEQFVVDGLRGDFNGDTRVDVADVDQLLSEVSSGSHTNTFDLTGDGLVTNHDVDQLITGILGTRRGDTDLDGDVDQRDFEVLAANFAAAAVSWGEGDYDGDGQVTFRDFVTFSINFGFKRPDATLPNPATADVADIRDALFALES